MLAAKPHYVSSIPRITWWKERTNLHRGLWQAPSLIKNDEGKENCVGAGVSWEVENTVYTSKALGLSPSGERKRGGETERHRRGYEQSFDIHWGGRGGWLKLQRRLLWSMYEMPSPKARIVKALLPADRLGGSDRVMSTLT